MILFRLAKNIFSVALRCSAKTIIKIKLQYKNNPKFLFSAVAWLANANNSVKQCIPLILSHYDFMSFFTDLCL